MSWEELRDVQKIRPSSGAFAALLGSGKAGIGWSSMKDGGWKHLEVGGDCRLPVSLGFVLHRDFRWL